MGYRRITVEDNGIRIIENDDAERKQYHNHYWGAEDFVLTKEQYTALRNGKCLIWNDGEYSHSIRIKE